ncbi:hypothetical protein HDU86_003149 [Geranomyces michiganensis]|nr:hypothetical protein HDU86_003149 [Geranomyces michiganensis]
MIDPADPNCLVGATVGGHLTLTRVLGMGSFAIVYEGVSSRRRLNDQQQTFAVKALFKQNLTPELLAVQKREAQLMANLGADHPNIVALLETHETTECVFLVMEMMETDLFDLIERSEVPFEQIPAVFDAICAAVAFAHAKGVYHRDLKPENVLVSAHLRAVKLTDFGLATTDKVSTEIGIGSVRYMDPQCFGDSDGVQQQQQQYDCAKNDAWALGIILLNLLTGQNPWIEPSTLTDRYYAEFAELGIESFRRRYGFSDELLAVLAKIFIDRLGDVNEIRALVAGVEYFYVPMGDDDGAEQTHKMEEEEMRKPTTTTTTATTTAAATTTTTSPSSWADDDGEMDYLDYAAYITPTSAKPPAVPELVVAPTVARALAEAQQQHEQEEGQGEHTIQVPSTEQLPAPPPPTPVPSRRRAGRRRRGGRSPSATTTVAPSTSTTAVRVLNNNNNPNPAAAATELVLNTIGRLQCFIAGVVAGDSIISTTLEQNRPRGVVYVVGG